MKYEKNYLRSGLKDLAEKCQGKPIAFQGIFRSDRAAIYGRFYVSHIKLYSESMGNKLYRLTSHVMLKMTDDVANMLRDDRRAAKPVRRKVVFIGYIYYYKTNGVERCGINLSYDIADRPIWLVREKKAFIPLLRHCYHPDLNPFRKKENE